jgi:hypothetical protein
MRCPVKIYEWGRIDICLFTTNHSIHYRCKCVIERKLFMSITWRTPQELRCMNTTCKALEDCIWIADSTAFTSMGTINHRTRVVGSSGTWLVSCSASSHGSHSLVCACAASSHSVGWLLQPPHASCAWAASSHGVGWCACAASSHSVGWLLQPPHASCAWAASSHGVGWCACAASSHSVGWLLQPPHASCAWAASSHGVGWLPHYSIGTPLRLPKSLDLYVSWCSSVGLRLHLLWCLQNCDDSKLLLQDQHGTPLCNVLNWQHTYGTSLYLLSLQSTDKCTDVFTYLLHCKINNEHTWELNRYEHDTRTLLSV